MIAAVEAPLLRFIILCIIYIPWPRIKVNLVQSVRYVQSCSCSFRACNFKLVAVLLCHVRRDTYSFTKLKIYILSRYGYHDWQNSKWVKPDDRTGAAGRAGQVRWTKWGPSNRVRRDRVLLLLPRTSHDWSKRGNGRLSCSSTSHDSIRTKRNPIALLIPICDWTTLSNATHYVHVSLLVNESRLQIVSISFFQHIKCK